MADTTDTTNTPAAPGLDDALRAVGRALHDIDAAPAMIRDARELYPDATLDADQVAGLGDQLAFVAAALANGLAVLEGALNAATRAAHQRETGADKPRQPRREDRP